MDYMIDFQELTQKRIRTGTIRKLKIDTPVVRGTIPALGQLQMQFSVKEKDARPDLEDCGSLWSVAECCGMLWNIGT